MKDSAKTLSICIPTRNRVNILESTLNSIYNEDPDERDFEVVIYDTSDGEEVYDMIIDRFNKTNLVYKKGENKGYLNLIEALKLGKGDYLKLHNDYSSFVRGSLKELINVIRSCKVEKPLLIFTNGLIKGRRNRFNSFDSFLYHVSYHSTWSSMFGVWKADWEQLKHVSYNKMFPHTSLLFEMSFKKGYRVENKYLFGNQKVENKGGYNLFDTFAIDFLNMVEELKKASKITDKTFRHIKKDMLVNFFVHWYAETRLLKNAYTFGLDGIREAMKVHYSDWEYRSMIILAYFRALAVFIKRAVFK